jgi:hypothetical protein
MGFNSAFKGLNPLRVMQTEAALFSLQLSNNGPQVLYLFIIYLSVYLFIHELFNVAVRFTTCLTRVFNDQLFIITK